MWSHYLLLMRKHSSSSSTKTHGPSNQSNSRWQPQSFDHFVIYLHPVQWNASANFYNRSESQEIMNWLPPSLWTFDKRFQVVYNPHPTSTFEQVTLHHQNPKCNISFPILTINFNFQPNLAFFAFLSKIFGKLDPSRPKVQNLTPQIPEISRCITISSQFES